MTAEEQVGQVGKVEQSKPRIDIEASKKIFWGSCIATILSMFMLNESTNMLQWIVFSLTTLCAFSAGVLLVHFVPQPSRLHVVLEYSGLSWGLLMIVVSALMAGKIMREMPAIILLFVFVGILGLILYLFVDIFQYVEKPKGGRILMKNIMVLTGGGWSTLDHSLTMPLKGFLKVSFLDYWTEDYLSNSLSEIRKRLKKMRPKDTMLLIYHGPGAREGWGREGKHLPYEKLARMLAECRGNVLVMSITHFAGAILSYLWEAGVDHCRVGVICGVYPPYPLTKEARENSFVQNLLDSWQRGELYSPSNFLYEEETPPVIDFKREISMFCEFQRISASPHPFHSMIIRPLRWGAALDHLCFKK